MMSIKNNGSTTKNGEYGKLFYFSPFFGALRQGITFPTPLSEGSKNVEKFLNFFKKTFLT